MTKENIIKNNQLDVLAKKAEPTSKSLFSKLKRQKPKTLDVLVHDIHEQVFDEIDCLNCANCCKSISPTLYDKDIERLAKHLRMKPSAFTSQYLIVDKEGDFVFKKSPCPFLLSDNYCSVYEYRPKACREYPHTDRKRFYQLLNLTLKNTFVCPAVYYIVEELKKKLK